MYNGTLNSGDDATGDFSFTITYDPKTKTATRTSDVVYTGTMVELKEQAVYTNKYEKIKESALTREAVRGAAILHLHEFQGQKRQLRQRASQSGEGVHSILL